MSWNVFHVKVPSHQIQLLKFKGYDFQATLVLFNTACSTLPIPSKKTCLFGIRDLNFISLYLLIDLVVEVRK